MGESPYRYSEEFGYEYVPGSINGGHIHDGTVLECYDPIWVINERGNPGRINGSYDEADLRVLAFGDSWTANPAGDSFTTWPSFLQEVLTKRLGRSAHVVNFGRDAYGVLQMFDLAATKVVEWKPDLVIFAFITDDLARDRFWRMSVVRDARERILTSVTPDPDPDWDVASDLYFMNSKATAEWCQNTLASQEKNDPIVRSLEEVVLEAQGRSDLRSDPWSLSQSFVLDMVLHGQPFYSNLMRAGPSEWPRHKMMDFAGDQRMVANIKVLDKTGIPYLLVHLAYYPELKKGQEYVGIVDPVQEGALTESLSRITGRSIYRTLDHVTLPIEDLKGLSKDFPSNHHPSVRGAQFYAEMVAEVLLRHGHVK